MQTPLQPSVVLPQTQPPAKKRGNWVRRVEHWAIRFFSVVFSVVTAHAIWWFFSSALDWLDKYQWIVTLLLAVGFAGLGYIISRGLAHRLQRKENLGVVMFIVVVFELVEVGACFVQAAVSISHIVWLIGFHGGMQGFLAFLCYLLLPIVPFFTIALAWFDMNLDREESGEVQQPAPKLTKDQKKQQKAQQTTQQDQQPLSPAPTGVGGAIPGLNLPGTTNMPARPAVYPQVDPSRKNYGYGAAAPNPNIPPYDQLPGQQRPPQWGGDTTANFTSPGQPTLVMGGQGQR